MTKYIFILYFLIFDYQSVFACKCELIDDIKTEFNSTDVIVRGKVISKENVTFISTLNKKGLKKINSNNALDNDKKEFLKNEDILRIEIEVLYTYKGKRLRKTSLFIQIGILEHVVIKILRLVKNTKFIYLKIVILGLTLKKQI